jgi:hypothetical protein
VGVGVGAKREREDFQDKNNAPCACVREPQKARDFPRGLQTTMPRPQITQVFSLHIWAICSTLNEGSYYFENVGQSVFTETQPQMLLCTRFVKKIVDHKPLDRRIPEASARERPTCVKLLNGVNAHAHFDLNRCAFWDTLMAL